MPYPCFLCRFYDFYFSECMKDEPCRYDNDIQAPDAKAQMRQP